MKFSSVGVLLATPLAIGLTLVPGPGRGAEDPASLPAALKEIVRSTVLSKARTGVMVLDLTTGKPVYSYDADELLNPASNMKILTSVAALARLGADRQFKTQLLLDEKQLQKGVLKSSLYLRGEGDPSLTTERMFRLVRSAQHAGLTEVKGDIVVDDTYFDDQWQGPGWEQDDSDHAYMAPVGAVALDTNSVAVHVWPGSRSGEKGRVEIDPPSDYFIVENYTETAPVGGRERVEVASIRAGDKQRIVVRARVPQDRPGTVTYKRISSPSLFAGNTLKAMLEHEGIKVRGKVRRAATPSDARELAVDWSESLTVILHTAVKWSQNCMMEQLLKVIGAADKGVPGTWPKGVEAVEDFLAKDVGIPRGSYVMKNGSGLNDTNRVSARQLATVLRWAYKQDLIRPEFLSALPIAGVDGTARHRMDGTPAAGRVRAKTGTLTGVTSLSGYASSVGGAPYVFSIMVNDYPGRLSTVLPGVDAIGEALAEVGSEAGPGAAVASAQKPKDDPSTPAAELMARIVTYEHLGAAADAKNSTFLRTALRSERDPALRSVIAEALYRSDSTDDASSRAVLENFSSGQEVFGRLHDAAKALKIAAPVVNTLLDLAAAGNKEAMNDLLAVALAAQGDPPLEELMAKGLLEVTRAAPEELLESLKGADDEQQGAVAWLIARGMPDEEVASKAEPAKKGPFQEVLAGAAAGPDPTLATFARALQARIAHSLERPSEVTPASTVAPPPAGGAAPGGG